MNKPKNIVFGVQMVDPNNGNLPTIEAMAMDADNNEKLIMRMQVREGPPSIQLFGPDGAVMHEVTGEEASDSEVDDPLNLAWTGDADSGFMDYVKAPVMDIGRRVIAAHHMAAAIGVSPQRLFHDMSRDMEGAVIGESLEEVKAEVAKRQAKASIEA